VSSADLNATGVIRIGGIPTAATIGNYFAAVSVPYWYGITDTIAGGQIASATAYIELNAAGAGAITTVNANTITATTRFRFAATYEV
jgi:hypothetical protein